MFRSFGKPELRNFLEGVKMKKTVRFLSYILVAVLSSVLTFALFIEDTGSGSAKLAALEALIEEKFIGEVNRTEIEDAAADAMVNALGDRWSYYIPADQYAAYEEQMNNAYVGVGITIQAAEDQSGYLIIKVNEGGPADDAGLLPGDVIVAVEGHSTAEMDVDETRNLVRGEENTQVQMTILREGSTFDVLVTRKMVKTPVATAQMLTNGVGMITITNFDARCADETIAAIEQLLDEGAVKLIFDVRFNPGGYADELVKVLDYLLPEGELFRTVDYAGNEAVDKSDKDCLKGIPMAVLVNGESYSAAEFFAAALREYDAAVVIGEPTVGKGYFQRTYELGDGSAVGLSVGKYFTPKGVSLAEEGGIVPDVEIPVDEETAAAIYAGTQDPMTDPQVLAAIEAIR